MKACALRSMSIIFSPPLFGGRQTVFLFVFSLCFGYQRNLKMVEFIF